MSFTRQTLPQNSIDRGLSDVNLEMLNKFLVIDGTSNISLSAIAVYVGFRVEYGEALCDRKEFLI